MGSLVCRTQVSGRTKCSAGVSLAVARAGPELEDQNTPKMTAQDKTREAFDERVRLFAYRHMLRHEKSPAVREIAAGLGFPVAKVRTALARLSESHAFMLQENGELWRVAPFSCVPTAFPVTVGKRTWFANCIWDALGIPAMLRENAEIQAACGCCNHDMPLGIHDGKLSSNRGIIHIAVPAREWYQDVVFT